jgi:hypothetical protein
MSQNINTIYNNVVISDTNNNTTTTLNNTSINFGSNLLTTPLNTTYSNSGIQTPISNISFGELFIIRDSVQAVALPIPNDGLTFKVVDTIEIANQENPIGATKTNYGYNSITSSNGLTVNGITTFSSVPKSNVLPSAGNDLVNLSYLQNNPPPSSVIFYLNNSQVPSPPISTYALLGTLQDELPQSSILTNISGVGTIQTIQTFSNYLSSLNAGQFIPSGIWDMNIFASALTGGDTTHINLYFGVFGRTIAGVETQIGGNSSLVSVDNTTIEQLKMTVALPYTDLTPYNSLVVRLYGINNRTGLTSITTYYEDGTTYSHLHTTFGVYIPPSLLSLNNNWLGLNSWTQYITVPDIVVNNNISTNTFTQTSTVITLDLGLYQYKNFSFIMNQNITAFNLSNGVSNGEYKIYLLGGGFTFNKNVGYKNSLAGNTLMASGSEWVIKIYCKSIGTYYMECLNFTL